MAGRPHKRHVQLELPKPRGVDKNGQHRGGAQPGAGRPKITDRRASERHQVRPRLRASQPVHVVLRATGAVGSLRTHEVFRAIREATLAVFKHETCHIVHLSIQRSHIHLLVEAQDRRALWTGMRAFGISAAKHINRVVGERRGGERRKGAVFTDRYHAVILSTPRQVRNCVAYVMNNWRHHGEHATQLRRPWRIDRYSTALAFDGWKEREHHDLRMPVPAGYDGPLTWLPKTWLLREGWRRHGLVSIYEVPGGGDE